MKKKKKKKVKDKQLDFTKLTDEAILEQYKILFPDQDPEKLKLNIKY